MYKKIKFFFHIYKRFGVDAIIFLVRSKFKIDRLNNINVKGIPARLALSNFGPDVTTLFQIFYAREYDIQLNVSPRFIIDCGANIGLSAVFFANKYPTATIVALEPDTVNFSYLLKNTQQFPNVICIKKAIWSHDAIMDVRDPGTGNWALQTKEVDKPTANTVESITLDKLMHDFQQEQIDLLKIDIEGAEKELFLTNYEVWLSKTRVIAIELHDSIDSEISETFFNALSHFSYQKYYNGENLICEFV